MSVAEIAELRCEIVRLTERLAAVESGVGLLPDAFDVEQIARQADRVRRRQWVRTAAAATAGGTAVALAAGSPAAADDPNDVTLGARKATTGRTQADYTGGGGGAAFVFQAGDSFDAALSINSCALAGWTNSETEPTGVHGLTGLDDIGASGVLGSATAAGTGVRGRSVGGPGLSGDGGTYGVEASGGLVAALLLPTGFEFPHDSTEMHLGGEMYVRAASDSGLAVELWFCTVGGSPGTWVQIAGPGLPGAFRALDPVRVYDSRAAAPDPGRLAGGSERIVDISSSRNLATGTSTGLAVPEGAGALAFNLAAVNTTGSGFLSVTPSFATEFSAASSTGTRTARSSTTAPSSALATTGR